MARFLYHDFQRSRRRMNWLPLAFFFLMGLLSGGSLYLRADDSFTAMMGRAFSSRVSIVSLASVYILPFLFSAFAVSVCQPRLFWPVAYCKALSVSYISLGIASAYGSGAWLAYLLLMFGDLCTIPMLWLYWLRNLDLGSRNENLRYWIALLLFGSVDYFIIAPFAAAL